MGECSACRKGSPGVSSVEEREVAETPDAPPDPPVALERRRRRLRWALLAALLIAVVGFVVVAETVSLVRHAKRAQSSLEAFKTALKAGDNAAATRDLAAADAALAQAHKNYHSFPLNLVSHIPVLGWPVTDAGHLLHAADDVSAAGAQALSLYDQVRGSGSKLFHNSTVSLSELHVVTKNAASMVARMDAATAELHRVHAAWWEPSVGSARDSALRQVISLRAQGADAQRVLALAPRLVGGNGPRTYLVAVLNPAELQFGGGSALNMLTVTFHRGHMKIVKSGATSDLTNGNTFTAWPALPADPWLFGHKKHELAAADRSPDFRSSGVELMRGYTATFHIHLDGIIALDPVALSDLMAQIPPFTTPGYGQLTAQNLVDKVLVEAYVKYPDYKLRHVYNDALMKTLLSRILGGGHIVNKGRALYQAAQQGHLQVYMNDATVQAQVQQAGLIRTLPPVGHDLVADFANNTNASKTDVWQQQQVGQKVAIHADGSAAITRTVIVTNNAPRYPGPGADPGNGYVTRMSRPEVAIYYPANADREDVTVGGVTPHFVRHEERGFRVLVVQMPADRILYPGQSLTILFRYTLPPGTVRNGVYEFDTRTQATVQPARVVVTVVGPHPCVGVGPGWYATRAGATFVNIGGVATTRAVCR